MNYQIVKAEIGILEILDKRLKPNSPKNLAIKNGDIRFLGKSCSNKHDGWRYTKGGQCIKCVSIARNNALNPRQRSSKNHEASLAAASNGQTTYLPEKPCKRGHLLRFVSSNNCVECDKIMMEKHKLTQKFNRITRLYNLPKNEYLQLVKDQNSSCKLCDIYEEDHFKLHVDHCHDTRKIRGLLCGRCNQGIGLLNHNSELLRKAALYCE